VKKTTKHLKNSKTKEQQAKVERLYEGYSSGGAGSYVGGHPALGSSRLSEDKRLKKILNEVMESHQRKYVGSFTKMSGSFSGATSTRRKTSRPVWKGPLDAASCGGSDHFNNLDSQTMDSRSARRCVCGGLEANRENGYSSQPEN